MHLERHVWPILVEPEEGLKPVDHEHYVMQGEIYTEQASSTVRLLSQSYDELTLVGEDQLPAAWRSLDREASPKGQQIALLDALRCTEPNQRM